MNRIKIGICGTHASGKTTYAKELSDHYAGIGKKVYIVEEVARSCPYTLGTVKAQEYIWERQMSQEAHAMSLDVAVVITDRTVLDNLVYYYDILDQMSIFDTGVRSRRDLWREMYETAIDWMPTYTQVIWLPLNLEWLQAADPIRPKDVEYARRIDALFDRFVQHYVTQERE